MIGGGHLESVRNYLRVRGEYHVGHEQHCMLTGTTSACAENTKPKPVNACGARNYLRVRGEYHGALRRPRHNQELPPRARRIRSCRMRQPRHRGTTSACAENTLSSFWRFHKPWNYLRVRGEYWRPVQHGDDIMELPPRARRIRLHFTNQTINRGTTSACAENTSL